MDLGIKNRVALIMASSKGLGKAVAFELAKEGAKVIICGTNNAALAETVSEISLITKNVFAVQCDLSKEKERENLIKQSINKFGNIEILITNSGGPATGSFNDLTASEWRQVFDSLFISVADIIKQILPSMKEKRFGRILTITSITVKQPADNLISSNAVRTSLVGLVKSLSNELAEYGITVNNLLPGYTETNRLKYLINKNPNIKQLAQSIPMKRFGTPEEFAAAAAFLVSERASYITGQSLAINGGWIRGY